MLTDCITSILHFSDKGKLKIINFMKYIADMYL